MTANAVTCNGVCGKFSLRNRERDLCLGENVGLKPGTT
jgi:hypothetical protein